jgi:histidinol-phosphate aminotransferase
MSSVFDRNVNRSLFEIKPYIPGPTVAEIIAKYGVPADKVIKLSSNENNLGPSPKAVEAVLQTSKVLHHYTDTRAVSLRKAIAKYVGLKPENILAAAGSSEIMSFIVRAFSKPGDEVVLADPSFTLYAEVALADGRTPVVIKLPPDFVLKIEDIERKLSARTRVIFITRPNNPTSKLPPLEMVQKLMQLAPDAVIVSDEAYVEFADAFPQVSAVNLISDKSNILVTRTFSKLFGLANLRIGYAVGPKTAISALAKVQPKWNLGMVAQNAAEAAVGDREHFAKTRQMVKQGRDYLMRELPRIPGIETVSDPQGNFVMAKVVGAGFAAAALTEALTRRGIVIRGDFHPDYVRISVGTMPQNKALIENLKELVGKGRARGQARA